MFFRSGILAILLAAPAQAFSPPTKYSDFSSTSLWAKSRKARREVERSRPKSFYDAIQDAEGNPVKGEDKKKKKKGKKNKVSVEETDVPLDSAEAARQERLADAQAQVDARPDVSTMEVDEETGIEVVKQGKSVMDVVTRKAVKLSTMGPEYRLAQMFPGVPPDVRDKYRVNIKETSVPKLVEALREACSVTLEDGTQGIPPHPSVSNAGLDFVLANRDYLGFKMKRTLGRLTMKTMSEGGKEKAKEMDNLWRNFMTIENHLSAPFRQMIMDGEGRVGPNFGNLDIKSYLDGDLYERTANYLVLKGMVAHWEKKVVDADFLEKNPQTKENYVSIMARGDPKRYLPDPPILFTLKECTQVCAMSQQTTKAFVDTPELFDDLPVEVRFFEASLSNKGGTALRKFMNDEFCPKEGVTPLGLIEGLRRLATQLDNMQIDPYGDILNLLERLILAMTVGTDEETNPYTPYLSSADPNGPGFFPTYTFNHDKLSRVRFLDSQYERGSVDFAPGGGGGGGFADLFNFGGNSDAPKREPEDTDKFYKVPEERAVGRPHELGWLDMFANDPEVEADRFGKVPPGKIISD